jgi:hypothetical protein
MVLWAVLGAIAFFVLQGWPEYKWPLFTVPVGILAVTGLEALVATAGSFGKKPSSLAVAAGTVLAILGFVVGAPVPQVQTCLLWSVVIGVCVGIAAELLIHRSRARRWMLQIVLAALAVSIGLAAIGPVHKSSRNTRSPLSGPAALGMWSDKISSRDRAYCQIWFWRDRSLRSRQAHVCTKLAASGELVVAGDGPWVILSPLIWPCRRPPRSAHGCRRPTLFPICATRYWPGTQGRRNVAAGRRDFLERRGPVAVALTL